MPHALTQATIHTGTCTLAELILFSHLTLGLKESCGHLVLSHSPKRSRCHTAFSCPYRRCIKQPDEKKEYRGIRVGVYKRFDHIDHIRWLTREENECVVRPLKDGTFAITFRQVSTRGLHHLRNWQKAGVRLT